MHMGIIDIVDITDLLGMNFDEVIKCALIQILSSCISASSDSVGEIW